LPAFPLLPDDGAELRRCGVGRDLAAQTAGSPQTVGLRGGPERTLTACQARSPVGTGFHLHQELPPCRIRTSCRLRNGRDHEGCQSKMQALSF
jgi:hypothetical protein